jgi:hypothetical protein
MKKSDLALAALTIAVISGTTSTTVSAAYVPYVSIDDFFAPDTVVSATLVNDQVNTGTDANGGFLYRTTIWDGITLFLPGIGTFGGGNYTAMGYVNSALPIPLLSGTSLNLFTQPPASTPPKKTPQQIAQWAADAAQLDVLAAGVNTAAEVLCPDFVNPIAIIACEASASLVAAQIGAEANGFIKDILDPADPNYTQIVSPASQPVLSAPVFANMTPAQTAAWADLVQNIDALAVLPDAIATSFSRAQGAFDAGAPQFWVDLQSEATDGYTQLAQADMGRIDADGNTLDLNTSVAGVPEPGTIVLLGSAVLVLILLIRTQHLVFLPLRRNPSAVA